MPVTPVHRKKKGTPPNRRIGRKVHTLLFFFPEARQLVDELSLYIQYTICNTNIYGTRKLRLSVHLPVKSKPILTKSSYSLINNRHAAKMKSAKIIKNAT